MPKISAELKRRHPKWRRQMYVGYVKIGDFRQITLENVDRRKRCQLI